MEVPAPILPFPIFRISSAVDRYLLYDISIITWLRKTHHILGVLIGTLPQIPQQNVFLGLPLELMPEEARLLCDEGLAYTVDDLEWHQEGMRSLTSDQRNAFVQDLARQGGEASKAAERKRLENTERALKRLRQGSTPGNNSTNSPIDNKHSEPDAEATEATDTLFSSSTTTRTGRPLSISESLGDSSLREEWGITPTTAYPPVPTPSNFTGRPSPTVKSSTYALFKHLHAHDYYMSPGLRFGCQFLVYPGDPLRFHSHFLAVGVDWDEEVDLLDLVGGGRLGTGVKKGWLIGGPEKKIDSENLRVSGHVANEMSQEPTTSQNRERMDEVAAHRGIGSASRVRTFCIEWGGM
ncbi:tRNA-splicing endonuclease subunit [Xylographa trunciseda]|nr:tRNA-splicing endonuclease subunit [Xylographa trunciseda]